MITITHTRTEGTLIEGSRKGDGVYELLRTLPGGWRYFPSLRQVGMAQSRDRAAKRSAIEYAAGKLREAGHEVAVEIDDAEARTFAEIEASHYERAEDRAGRMAARAVKAAAASEALHARAHEIADMIPFGQPILVGHPSEGRHRRDLGRIHDLHGKGFEEGRKAEHYERRAANAETYQASRESVPVTLRRIARLEADERRTEREIKGDGAGNNWREKYYAPERKPATGERLAQLEARLADLREEIAYWRGVIAQAAEANGVRVWGPAEFTKGDYASDGRWWFEVLRVSAKSVSVPDPLHLIGVTEVMSRERAEAASKSRGFRMHTRTMPYDSIRGRKSAAEMAEMLAMATVAAS